MLKPVHHPLRLNNLLQPLQKPRRKINTHIPIPHPHATALPHLRGDTHRLERLSGHEDIGFGAEANDDSWDAEEKRLSPEFEELLAFEGLDLSVGAEFG